MVFFLLGTEVGTQRDVFEGSDIVWLFKPIEPNKLFTGKGGIRNLIVGFFLIKYQ